MKIFKKDAQLLSTVRRCVQNYNMIEDGDKIAVGVSGGKDSSALLCALALMRRFYPKKYDVVAINIDIGVSDMDFSSLAKLCAELEVEFVSVKTQISEIVFGAKQDGCSLCSRMRRGALHSEAERLGCNKVALGHTRDDVAITLIMNLFYAGKIEVFWPVNTPDEREMTLIRPLTYTAEKTIKSFCSTNDVPIIKNNCPMDKNTKRQVVKEILDKVERENPGVYHRIFRAIEKFPLDGF